MPAAHEGQSHAPPEPARVKPRSPAGGAPHPTPVLPASSATAAGGGQAARAELARPTVLQAVLRYPVTALLVVGLCLAAGVGVLIALPPQPTGEALVVVEDPLGRTAEGSVAARYTQDQAALIGSRVVAEPASALLNRRLGADERMTAGQVAAATTVEASLKGNSVHIGFTAPTAEVAAAGASAVVEAYEQVLEEQTLARTAATLAEIDSAIAQVDQQLAAAPPVADVAALRGERARLQTVRTDAVLAPHGSHGVKAVAVASEPSTPWIRTAIRDLGVALTLGVALAGALAYLRAARRMPMSSPGEPCQVLSAPLLAEVSLPRRGGPSSGSPGSTTSLPGGVQAATAFLLARNPRAIVAAVVAARSGDGAADVATGLAVFAHQHGRRTALLDVSVDEPPRLIEVSADTSGAPRSWEHGDLEARLPDLADREPAAAWCALPQLADSLRRDFGFVVLVLPSVAEFRAAAAMLAAADVTVPVIAHGTPLAAVEQLADVLSLSGAHVGGYVYTRPGGRWLTSLLRAPVGRRSDVSAATALQRVAVPASSWTSQT